MPWCKYTREILQAAVAASTSMAGVLRHLGLPPNGGSHAHLRRRIDRFEIDTSHFLGRAHLRGTSNARRRSPQQVLVLRPADRRRAAPHALRRALLALGRPHRCAACGVDDTWNGRPLTLHIDHIDGRFWDCRPDNLRFLCPNCHSQTPTHAGRNRSRLSTALVRVDRHGSPTAPATTAADRATVLSRVTAGELGVTDAARLIGCHRNTVYALLRRMTDVGSTAPRRPVARVASVHRDAVITFAVQNPALGSKKIAAALRTHADSPIRISHGTVATILAAAGLHTASSRREAGEHRSTLPSRLG